MSYNDVVVKKPWGKEYLIYENENLGIWFLHIEEGQATSMHCHPKKNTGLIVMDGFAEVSFLKNKIPLKGVDKIMIFRGRFHATQALSKGGAFILEVESPQDKHDLVRLKDNYGRENKPYESKKHEFPKDDSCMWFEDPGEKTKNKYDFCGCKIVIENLNNVDDIKDRHFDEAIVVLRGGLISKNNDPIVQKGDVIAGHTINKLSDFFDLAPNTTILSVRRNN